MAEKLTFFEKADVNGANAREVYSYIKPLAPNADGTLDIRWNFGMLHSLRQRSMLQCNILLIFFFFPKAKFLVDHEGNAYKRYDPSIPPLGLKNDIEALLKKRNGS
jgi:glutathione peroxidase